MTIFVVIMLLFAGVFVVTCDKEADFVQFEIELGLRDEDTGEYID